MIEKIFRLIREGISMTFSSTRNKEGNNMRGISIIIVTAALTLFGIFSAVEVNFSVFLSKLSEDAEVNVYLKNDNGGRSISDIEGELKAIENVSKVRFVSREDRLGKVTSDLYGEEAEDKQAFWSGDENPLRDSYVITVSDTNLLQETISALNSVEGVEETVTISAVFDGVNRVAESGKTAGIFFVIVFSLLSLFIISSTVNMGISTARDEIEVMRLIGATDSYIAAPFIVRAVLIGIISAFLATIISVVAYSFVYYRITDAAYSIINLVSVKHILATTALRLIAAGILVGAAAGILSVKAKVLKY